MSSKKTSKNTEAPQPRVYGWVAGVPAYLQEHPDNKNQKK